MDVYLDLGAHLICSFLVGFLVWKHFFPKKKHYLSLSLISAFISGILIDVDHFIDYFLAFGPHFNLSSFLHSEQFRISHKTYLFFHAYEYVLIGLFIFFILKNKKKKMIVGAFTLSMLVHLLIDTSFFSLSPEFYLITVRIANHFNNLH